MPRTTPVRPKVKSFFIGQAHGRETLRDGPQADPFDSNLFLALDVSGADDQCEPFQSGCLRMVVLNNRFERTAHSTMIQFHF